MVGDLTGAETLDIPRKSAVSVAGWTAENTNPSATDLPSFDNITMTPKEVAVLVEVSRKLAVTSNPSAQGLIVDDLGMGIARAKDKAFINRRRNERTDGIEHPDRSIRWHRHQEGSNQRRAAYVGFDCWSSSRLASSQRRRNAVFPSLRTHLRQLHGCREGIRRTRLLEREWKIRTEPGCIQQPYSDQSDCWNHVEEFRSLLGRFPRCHSSYLGRRGHPSRPVIQDAFDGKDFRNMRRGYRVPTRSVLLEAYRSTT